MEENYWAEQQRRMGHGFIRLTDRDENYWTQRQHGAGQRFIRLGDRDENYWTRGLRPATAVRSAASKTGGRGSQANRGLSRAA
jgi:hypothetical protein